MSYFSYGGRCSKELGLAVSGKEYWNAPVPELQRIEIPGRDGALLVPGGRFQNVEVQYQCFCKTDRPAAVISELKAWLYGKAEYRMLADSDDIDYFRYGFCGQEIRPVFTSKRMFTAAIPFTCKPFRYSYAGQERMTAASPLELNNPEPFASLPYLKLYGTGDMTLNIGAKGWIFQAVEGYIELDSEMMNAYKDTALQNHKMQGEGFPRLEPGWNAITFDGAVQKIEMIPRWRTL